MPKLVELLKKNKMTLIVALPDNDLDLAEAAIAGGADAIELRINMQGYSSFEQERERLENILAKVDVPVGIAVGRDRDLAEDEIKQVDKMGFDFFNVGVEHLSPSLLGTESVSKILTINSRYTLDEIVEVSQTKFEALDAAILPSSEKGKELQVGDLQGYISIVLSAGMPVIVPLANFTYDLEAMKKAITPKTKLVFIANPNNPTGTSVGTKEIEGLLKDNESAEVISAEPLTDQEKKYILKAIKEKGNAKTEVKFTMDKGLTGGLTLKIDKQIIDGSIAYRVNKAAAALKKDLR